MELTKQQRTLVDQAVQIALEAGLDGDYINDCKQLTIGWLSVSDDQPNHSWFISYGFADATLGLLVYDKQIEVGIGEPLRPYTKLYQGVSSGDATRAYLKQARRMVGLDKWYKIRKQLRQKR